MVRCACCVGFCTVWWYLVFVCWRGGSFCLLRRLLSSMPRWSASVLDALIGEPTRCCAGNGADEYSRASLERDPVTRPSLRKAGKGEIFGRCVCLQSEHRGEGRQRVSSRVSETREDPDQARRAQGRANSRPFFQATFPFLLWRRGGEGLPAKSLSHKASMFAGQADFGHSTGCPILVPWCNR